MAMPDSQFASRAAVRIYQSVIRTGFKQSGAHVELTVDGSKHQWSETGAIATVDRLAATDVKRDGISRTGSDREPEQRTELSLGLYYRKHDAPDDGKKGTKQVSNTLSLAIRILQGYLLEEKHLIVMHYPLFALYQN
jgi:hypothetical protein